MSRVQLRLHKGDEVKYLSHLDLMRAFEYALRRARIPVAYSEGFNPRPKMSFGSAVGVGVTSDDERIILELAADMNPYELRECLNSRFPAGLRILDAEILPEGVKSPIGGLNASRFRIELSCGEACDCSAVEDIVQQVLDSAEVRVMRTRDTGTKEVDIRPNLLGAEIKSCAGSAVVIEVSLKLGSAGGARPQDFVQALSNRMANINVKGIHRTVQFNTAD